MLSSYNHLRGRCNFYRDVLACFMCLRRRLVSWSTTYFLVHRRRRRPPSRRLLPFFVLVVLSRRLAYFSCRRRQCVDEIALVLIMRTIFPTSSLDVMTYIFRLHRSLRTHSYHCQPCALSLELQCSDRLHNCHVTVPSRCQPPHVVPISVAPV